jgi:hypothetical protein
MNQITLSRISKKAFALIILLIAFLLPAGSYLYGHTTVAAKIKSFSESGKPLFSDAVILIQPTDQMACPGSSASFSLTDTGATAYQWQEYIASWNNLTNAGIYSGATSAQLTISDVTGLGGRLYRCVVSGSIPPADTTLAAMLYELTPPQIFLQPIDTIICAQNLVYFSVGASGSAISYQWQVDTGTGFINIPPGGPYMNDTTATLTVLALSSQMSGYHFQCVVSGACSPPAISAKALLTVNDQPAIIVQPSPAVACAGDSTSFTITASGAGLMYQWQADQGYGMVNLTDSLPYSGTTTPTLKITGVTAGMDQFTYQCIVFGPCGFPVTSGNPPLTVNTPPSIDYTGPNQTICTGDNTYFVVIASGIVNSYQWQVSTGSGFVNLSDSLPYAGTATPYMTLTGADASMNGNIYQCLVSGICAPPGISTWDTLHINTGPKIYMPPQDTAICDGGTAYFSVLALGVGMNFQWQEDQGNGYGFNNLIESSPYYGTNTDSLIIMGVNQGMDTYKYRCIVTGACNPADTSAAGILYMNTPVLVYSLPLNTVICAGSPTSFSLLATGNNLNYQWQVDQGSGFANLTNAPPYLGVKTDSLQIANAPASFDGYVYRCLVTNTCGQPDSSAIASLGVNTPPVITFQPADTTICPGLNAAFSITVSGTALAYQWQVDTGTGMKNLTDTLFYTGTATSMLSLTAAPSTLNGYKYRCIISGTCPPTDTSKTAVLHFNTIPAITLQPRDTTICPTDNATFAILATGTGLTYQWQADTGTGFVNLSDGGNYTGSATAALLINTVPFSFNGYRYRCVMTGTCLPADTSAAAILHLRAAPAILSGPSSSMVCAGANIWFVVSASGNSLSYQWQVDKGTGFANISNVPPYSGASSDSLLITGASTTMNNYSYQCIVSGKCSPPATTATAILQINTAPTIKTQPVTTSVCEGNNSSFVVAAKGTALTYQWQINTGSGFTNLTNTAHYSGTQTDSLSIQGVTSSMEGYLYKCIISGTCSPDDTTSAAVLHIHTAPLITSEPTTTAVCSGNNTSFTVTATGSGLSYQWQVNTGSGFSNLSNIAPYSGVTTPTLTITPAGITLDGNTYRCVVSGTCVPADTSKGALLHINTSPVIASQPAAATLCTGDNTTFVVGATGSGLTYQWQANTGSGFSNVLNAAPYSGATSASLQLTGATSPMDGYAYRCIVSGACPSADTSISVILHMKPVPKITIQPTHASVCDGGTTSFTVAATGAGISYQWQVNTGSGFTSLANSTPYSGVNSGTLTITGASMALNGYAYQCLINYSCPLPLRSDSVTLTIFSAPLISMQPANDTVCEGNLATFNLSASGDSLKYQWQVDKGSGFSNLSNNATYFGATASTLMISGTTSQMNGYLYQCIISGICSPGVTTTAAILYIKTLPAIVGQPLNVSLCAGSMASFVAHASGTGLNYVWQVNSGSGYVTISNSSVYSGATTDSLTVTGITPSMDSLLYHCIVSGKCLPPAVSDSAWLLVNPHTQIKLQPADSFICEGGKAGFTVAAIGASLSYQWQANSGSGSGFANLTNTPPYSGVTTASLTVTPASGTMAGTIYRCIVSSACASPDTSAGAAIHFNAPPAITSQPADARICDGNNTVFAVVASGAGLTYQWQVKTGSVFTNISNAGIYTGATSSSLIITGATVAMNGYQYQCLVFGSCGPTVTSLSALLNIDTPPAVTTQPSNEAVCAGANTQFSLIAGGSGLTYQWQSNAGSGFTNLSDNTVYSGSSTAALTITGANMTMDGYLYRVIITGNCTPPATSNSAQLTVHALPVLTLSPTDTTVCSGILVPARAFTSIPGGATIDWSNSNTLIGLSIGAKNAASVPAFVAQNGTSLKLSSLVTLIPQLNGCAGPTYSYAIHVNPLPVVVLNLAGLNPECLNMTSVALSGGSPAGGVYSGTTVSGGNFSPSTAGIGTFPITYTYADSNACSSSATSPLNVDICTGLDQQSTAGLQIDVYPNPFGNKISVVFGEDKTNVLVEVFNTSGQRIIGERFSGKTLDVETSIWPAGMYYLRVITPEGLAVKKIVKD